MNIYGIAYRAKTALLETQPQRQVFSIVFSYIRSWEEGAELCFPNEWQCTLPDISGFVKQRLGASETRGLLGGVEDCYLAACSETIERAIGDALAVTLCHILDNTDYAGESSVLVLGPALPKVVGRFASLRPPQSTHILWICSKSILQWIGEFYDKASLLPSYPALNLSENAEVWEDEPLIWGAEYSPDPTKFEGRPSLVVQALELQEQRQHAELRNELERYKWLDYLDCVLPREFVLLTWMIENRDRIENEPEVDLSQIEPPWPTGLFEVRPERSPLDQWRQRRWLGRWL